MPLYIRNPSFSTYWKVELLSAIFPAIAYGIVVVLSGNCFHLLQRKRDLYPNRRRILLLIYVIFMLLNSTWHQIGSIFRLMAILTRLTPNYIQYNLYFFYSFGIPFTVTMWGADGFMVRILILRQEQRFTMQLQIWRCLVLYQDVSKGPRVGIIVILLLISFASFGKPILISTPSPPFKVLTRILSLRCHDIGLPNGVTSVCRRPQASSIRLPSIHFTFRSCKYHTHNVGHFPTRLPSKIRPKCPWSGTWVSLHQHYHHVCRIFSTDGHFLWHIHHSGFRVSVSSVLWGSFYN